MNCAEIHKSLMSLPIYCFPDRGLPTNGLYFFYEQGEYNNHDGELRIVRVGNHPRSQNNLRKRLLQHYTGNKNGSVFRKFLGGALMRRLDPKHPCLAPAPGKGHWEKQDAKVCDVCRPFEEEVSRLLRKRFTFRVVKIDDMGFRNKMEQEIIATLSSCLDCRPSKDWLGQFSYNGKVQCSGMWNSEYVCDNSYFAEDEWRKFMGAVRETEAICSAQHPSA